MKYLVAALAVPLALLGCASAGKRTADPSPGSASKAPAPAAAKDHECPCRKSLVAQGESPAGPADHGAAAVPVTARDPAWGDMDAPVTIVVFSDFQCPFCARVLPTLDELKRAHGPSKLRIVWKHYPLPFHANARGAAEAAASMHTLGGNDAFWKFHDLAFAHQERLSPDSYLEWAALLGVDSDRFVAEATAPSNADKVSQDVALAKQLSIRGTPTFLINGVPLSGAQPVERFQEIVTAQLAAAEKLRAEGTPAHQVYPILCARNLAAHPSPPAPARPKPKEPAPDEDKVHAVPVDPDDPSLGPADALVTVVVFSDFQCPFCERLGPTLASLAVKYDKDLRIVWKDFPLPFHEMAVPAAVLARVALAKKGMRGFWQAHDALFARHAELDESALKEVAKELGLSWGDVRKALAERRFQSSLARELTLGRQLAVQGTPTSFVNGRRIEGAMPADVFVKVIDAELVKAKAMVDAGQARGEVYAAIVASVGQPKPAQPATDEDAGPADDVRRAIDPPTRDNPTKGGPAAKVTLQIFGDFQSPYALQMNHTLAELEKKYGSRLGFVWRHYPLPSHRDAPLAAEAAQEVFAQKGAAGFWKYHDLLFAAQAQDGLGRETLEKLAKQVAVNLTRFRAALDSHKHKAVVDRDVEAARKADLGTTPTFVINDYVLSGPRTLAVFEQWIDRAMAESTR